MVSMHRHWDADDIPDLAGMNAVVTGATSGIGFRVAGQLAASGAQVVMACRNPEKALAAARAIGAGRPGPEPAVVIMDLADLASVKAGASRIADQVDHLDILVNNAGVMGIPRMVSPDGFEMQLATNLLGHYALTGMLMDLLSRAAAARVVSLGSIVHWFAKLDLDDLNAEQGYSKMGAYSQSKLATLLFAFELDRRLRAAGSPVSSLAAHPGWARTHLQSVGPEMSGAKLLGLLTELFTIVFAQSDAKGALPVLRAATDPAIAGGAYVGPRGIGGLHGYPAECRRASRAADAGLGTALWERLSEMTGVSYLGS